MNMAVRATLVFFCFFVVSKWLLRKIKCIMSNKVKKYAQSYSLSMHL